MRKVTALLLSVLLMVYLMPSGFIEAKDQDLISSEISDELLTDDVEYVDDEILVKYTGEKKFKVVKVKKGDVEKAIEKYKKLKNVEVVEPNYIAHAHGVSDPYYDYQWNLRSADEGGMNAEAAWNYSTGSGVVVAVIDTGVANNAPDLLGTSFTDGYDFANGDTDPYDDEGHGTHVAGTIAQATNNGEGVAGVAYDATIMPIKVLDSSGSGSYYDIADGIRYAADEGADVINMSLGGSRGATVLEDAIIYAYNKGVTIVASAGNSGRQGIGYPAAYDDYVIAVGATGSSEPDDGSINDIDRAYYSSYGNQLDIMAPGGDYYDDNNNPGDGSWDGILQNTFEIVGGEYNFSYYFYQGTSMASPHVAGVAALLLSKDSTLTPTDVEKVLAETALKVGENFYGTDYYGDLAGLIDSTWNKYYGYGLIDAEAALSSLSVTPNTAPSVTVNEPIDGSSFDYDASITFSGSATDSEDGDLTVDILWKSNLDGNIGSGGSFTANLSVGTHTITASVTDSGGLVGSTSFVVTVNTNSELTPIVTIDSSIDSDVYSFKDAVTVSVSLENVLNPTSVKLLAQGVDGTSTAGIILWEETKLTDTDGNVSFLFKIGNSRRNPAGDYTIEALYVDGNITSNIVTVTVK